MSIHFNRMLLSMLSGALGSTAGAGFVEVENAHAWFNAAGPTTTIDFVLDVPQILSYESQLFLARQPAQSLSEPRAPASGPTPEDQLESVSDQYAGLGVVFPDGNDVAFDDTIFDLDGWGVQGAPGVSGAVVAQLLAPHNAIGFVYHGTITCKLYSNDQLVYTSTLFGAQGSNGAFAGIVSTAMFDRVVVVDVFDGEVFIDNMYFDTVPGPCAGGL